MGGMVQVQGTCLASQERAKGCGALKWGPSMAVVMGAANNETYKQTNPNGPSTALHQDKREVTEKMLKGPQDGGSSNSQRDCPSDLEM